MKTITYDTVVREVAALCVRAAYDLPADVRTALEAATTHEKSDLGRDTLQKCLDNAAIARSDKVPICQDTGFAVYFVELGNDVHIAGGLLGDAIAEGTVHGYADGYLRNSIVSDPVFDRANTGNNTPPVIHISLVKGDTLTVTLAPKGGGSENKTALAMLKPSDGADGIIRFVVDTVVGAGGDPCPPTIVGVGIGGTAEKAMLCAKHALLRPLASHHADPRYGELEETLLAKINASGVGPQGLGGTVTALAVHIETYPCHIASLPVAVCLNCHAARHASVTL